jgi:transposase
VHGAQIKAKVLAECRRPGASVSAVALAHGLNANVVHKWPRGQGLKRAGLTADRPAHVAPAKPARATPVSALQFVPLHMSEPAAPVRSALAAQPPVVAKHSAAGDVIEVELRGGNGQVTVRWPSPQAAQCTQWLRELAATVLVGVSAP